MINNKTTKQQIIVLSHTNLFMYIYCTICTLVETIVRETHLSWSPQLPKSKSRWLFLILIRLSERLGFKMGHVSCYTPFSYLMTKDVLKLCLELYWWTPFLSYQPHVQKKLIPIGKSLLDRNSNKNPILKDRGYFQ